MVIAILVGLAAILVVSSGGIMSSTNERATQALMHRLKIYLDEYFRVTGTYPPDGFDTKVVNADKVELRGSAALYYALTTPINKRVMIGGMPREVTANAIGEFKESELLRAGDDFPGVVEIVDGFNQPLHYDNTQDGRFQPQDGLCHYPEMDDHPDDPRTVAGPAQGGVEAGRVNRVQSRGYDLWSYGVRGHDVDAKPVPPIASWDLNQ
jgi:hypothetical protein